MLDRNINQSILLLLVHFFMVSSSVNLTDLELKAMNVRQTRSREACKRSVVHDSPHSVSKTPPSFKSFFTLQARL